MGGEAGRPGRPTLAAIKQRMHGPALRILDGPDQGKCQSSASASASASEDAGAAAPSGRLRVQEIE